MKNFVHALRENLLLAVAAALGTMSLLLDGLSPSAALLIAVWLGMVFAVSALISLERRDNSPTSAVR